MKTLLKIYSKLRRLFDWPNFKQLPEELRKLDIDSYSKYINQFEYKYDLFGGLFDHTASIKHFLKSVKHNRDCDDWARMWSAWGYWNEFKSHEYILTQRKHFFTKSHFITLLEKEGKWYLCNYRYKGFYNSEEEALNSLGYDIIVKYRTFENS